MPAGDVVSGVEPGVLQRKVCLIGATAVGKTSLVRRCVESAFSESYLATVGVKVDRKRVVVGERRINLMLWDLQGEEDGQAVRMAYLRGASGYLLVIDGTRAATFATALDLQRRAAALARAPAPFVVLVNKADRYEEWEVTESDIARLRDAQWPVLFTSAKTGVGVETAFGAIAERVVRV